VADTAISQWWTATETAGSSDPTAEHQKNLLMEDADIVAVALESMTVRRDKLLALAKREESYLLRKLKPHYESRDEVRHRMGEQRWKNNPNPKRDYAKLRVEFEQELRAVRKAMEFLEQLDPASALQKAMDLQQQLASGVRSKEGTAASDQRYNGLRPSWEWLEKRVPLEEYPDATEYGWTFTGSWEATEFFEKDLPEGNVKLDWYFTTATVKTSLDHPTKGKTQMFGKKCNPNQYDKILRNPRVHTGKRYQRRPKR